MKEKIHNLVSELRENKISVEKAAAELKLLSLMGGRQPMGSSSNKSAVGNLTIMFEEDLKEIASNLLKVDKKLLSGNFELSEFGFDSFLFTQLTHQLNSKYQLELTPAVFFEYSSLQSLTKYLVSEYFGRLSVYYDLHVHNTEGINNHSGLEYVSGEELIEPKEIKSRYFTKKRANDAVEVKSPSIIEPIAIVGLSGKFPLAQDIDEFWLNLLKGRDCIEEEPENRFDWWNSDAKIKWGGFLDSIDEFDPLFFGISPKEAECMDPQQRLLMTYVWKVIEDAGYSAQTLSDTNTAIYVGTTSSGYYDLIHRSVKFGVKSYSVTGTVPSIGPNRMSYFLNIHGPSEPIETACSSSLVAIHRAVSAIQDGSCEMAIAGGVNTLVDPLISVSFAKAGMLCPDGRCKTFSGEANGYVRGEGVGMLFLKRLSAAERDGDHIYAVIRGTSVNHGGRSNSLTAPNSKAQADLLIDAYRKAGVDPRTVTYIETHGTGTKLGDPVEINGLRTAFQKLYEETGDSQVEEESCGLGAVKSNIGHLELAAGVAGVIKVLLQMRHKTLVKSLHCENINPYIELQGSPFYIVQENREWKALRDSSGRELPRRAGVSSFGFGGVNAHLVLEEYIGGNEEVVTSSITQHNPGIYLLSAKNKDRLKEQAGQLLQAIETGVLGEEQLADAAFTLQVGREPMEERLAIVADSVKGLKEKLSAFMAGREDIPNLYQGQVQRNNEMLSLLSDDDDLNESIHRWMRRKKYVRLLELWVQGLNVDWNRLYEGIKPRRISLPTYPFAREHYWILDSRYKKKIEDPPVNVIHPLVHKNVSDFTNYRFNTTLSGEEFFLRDHIINGNKVLPGMAYLEMVRAALEQLSSSIHDERYYLSLRNVIWIKPLHVNSHSDIHITIVPKKEHMFHFEIFSSVGLISTIHCRGVAIFKERHEQTFNDLDKIHTQLDAQKQNIGMYYDILRKWGVDLGSSLQGLLGIYEFNSDIFVKVGIPKKLVGSERNLYLHPSLLDSTLQGAVLYAIQSLKGQLSPMLPFLLKEVDIFGPCTSLMWAKICFNGSLNDSDKIPKLDIYLFDEHGALQIRFKGIASKTLKDTGVALPVMVD